VRRSRITYPRKRSVGSRITIHKSVGGRITIHSRSLSTAAPPSAAEACRSGVTIRGSRLSACRQPPHAADAGALVPAVDVLGPTAEPPRSRQASSRTELALVFAGLHLLEVKAVVGDWASRPTAGLATGTHTRIVSERTTTKGSWHSPRGVSTSEWAKWPHSRVRAGVRDSTVRPSGRSARTMTVRVAESPTRLRAVTKRLQM